MANEHQNAEQHTNDGSHELVKLNVRQSGDLTLDEFDVVELEQRLEFVGFMDLNINACHVNSSNCNSVSGCT